MIRAIWFAVKIAVLTGVAVWVIERPGLVHIEWQDYNITVALGFFLLAVFAVVAAAVFLYQVFRTFADFPRSFARYREIRRREKGYRALTLGLTAVAAGDAKAASKQAARAGKFMPGDTGLPLLLKAQAARLDGREDDAAKAFFALVENKDASFLGIRGLLQSALDSADHETALSLADKALSLHPRQKWILKIAYDLRTRLQRWPEAYQVLSNAEASGALSPEKARSDRAAILLAQALRDEDEGFEAEALSNARGAVFVDRSFAPAALLLAGLYNRAGKRAKAIRVVEKAWKAAPHPALATLWDSLIDPGKAENPAARLRWAERLLKLHPDSADGLMFAGRVAMESSIWGVARDYLEKAEAVEPSAALYLLRATLEERSGGGEDAVRLWLERAAAAPPAKVWVCRETGRIYDAWQPVAQPHGSFNTIVWDYPAARPEDMAALSAHGADMAETLAEAPRIPVQAQA